MRCLAVVALLAAGLLAPAPASAQSGQRADTFRLEQNFPNPFTPGVSPTILTFTLPAESHVRLTVYNLLGQEVVILLDEQRSRGTHRVAWDGTDAKGDRVPAGAYWYKLEGAERNALRRLRVLREPGEE